MVQAEIKITGLVQGVFFRAEAKSVAARLNIQGWIKNEPDGSVSALAQGEKPDVESFIDWCRQGPPGSIVTNVTANIIEKPEQICTGFIILD